MAERLLEMLHYRGGHCGPYSAWGTAIQDAYNRVSARTIRDEQSMETIVPYSTRDKGGWLNSDKVTAVQIISDIHHCGCKLCTLEGAVFYHVRAIERDAF